MSRRRIVQDPPHEGDEGAAIVMHDRGWWSNGHGRCLTVYAGQGATFAEKVRDAEAYVERHPYTDCVALAGLRGAEYDPGFARPTLAEVERLAWAYYDGASAQWWKIHTAFAERFRGTLATRPPVSYREVRDYLLGQGADERHARQVAFGMLAWWNRHNSPVAHRELGWL